MNQTAYRSHSMVRRRRVMAKAVLLQAIAVTLSEVLIWRSSRVWAMLCCGKSRVCLPYPSLTRQVVTEQPARRTNRAVISPP
jgi:hypothetical protein